MNARAGGRPRFSRLSGAHLLIALAATTAVVANYAVLRARDDTVRIAVVATELDAGVPLDRRALAFDDVRADEPLLEALVTADEVDGLAGQVVVGRLRPGDPLRHGDLEPPVAAGGRRAMSLPLAPEQAVGGRLAVADRVDVIEVRDGRAAYLVTGAEVLDVPSPEGPAGLTGLQTFSVTLAVDDETALRLALAQREADLHLVRATGSHAPRVSEVAAPPERAVPDSPAPEAEP